MKIKHIILSITLAVLGIFTTLSLSGCGEVSLDTLQSNFEKLDATYAKYSEVFTTGVCESMNTKYLVDYGDIVNGYVSENKEEYRELSRVYNITLAISSDYIDNNKSYILNFSEENLNENSKECVKALNESLEDYTNSIEKFVSARKSLITHFEQFNGQLEEKDNLAFLRKFKKQYGALVEKNVILSTNLAKSVESTEIFDILKRGTPIANDTKIIKEYIRAKLLPIFSEFKITEMENNLYWGAYSSISTPAKQRIDDLMAELDNEFEDYKSKFVDGNENFKVMTKDEMSDLLDIVDEFLVEANSYFQSLHGFDVSALVENCDIDLEEYKKTNIYAEIYLQKMEQFIEISLGNFTDNVLSYIY
ncbi:MAG: hypothetical protein ACI4R8_05115 [Candidatus Caccovivens sp.]